MEEKTFVEDIDRSLYDFRNEDKDAYRIEEGLTKEIVEQIQEYVDGVKVYIPKKADSRKSWGSNTDTKQLVSSRNQQIRLEHQNGLTVSELAQKYFLAEKTIQKIVYSRQSTE